MSDATAAPAASPASRAADVAAALQAKFSLPGTALSVQRPTRLWVEVDQAGFAPLFDWLVKGLGFSILCTISGLDLGSDLGFIYHLARDGGVMANVKTRAPKGQAIDTVTGWFPGAGIYERELVDLLGAEVRGLPPGARYPLPDEWPAGQHPLLKDWTPKAPAADAAAAEGAAKNE